MPTSEQGGAYTITCPYCFQAFHDNEVVFRLSHGYSRGKDEGTLPSFMETASEKAGVGELRSLYYCYEECDNLDNDDLRIQGERKVDKELVRFWASRGGKSGYIESDPHWNRPHADPRDKEAFHRIVSMERRGRDVPGPDGMVRDGDNFVRRIIEKDGDPGAGEMTRLCPYCHNPLPLGDYGKYPTWFIGITGMTGAGKTVFLTQLLSNLPELMRGSGYHIGSVSMNLEPIAANNMLPEATEPSVMRRPWAINLLAGDTRQAWQDDTAVGTGQTLVFYDIAGENCVVGPADSQEKIETKRSIASYLGRMHALLFLVDPEQIPALSGCSGNQTPTVANLVRRIVNIRTENVENPTWDDVPVAIVVTKADGAVRSYLENNVLHRQLGPVSTKDCNQFEYRGFPRDEFVPINTCMHGVFRDNVPAVEGALEAFAQRGYFVVSALPDGTRQTVSLGRNRYSILPADYDRLKVMKRWLNKWDSCETAQERRLCLDGGTDTAAEYPGLVHNQDGSALRFPFDCSSDALRNVRTDIVAHPFSAGDIGCGAPSRNLTVGDIKDSVFAAIAGGNARPLRIEEPLKWLLWRCGVISEPVFEFPEEPHYPFLCRKRKKARLLEEHERTRELLRVAFYECESGGVQ